jgi:hypothetical protein
MTPKNQTRAVNGRARQNKFSRTLAVIEKQHIVDGSMDLAFVATNGSAVIPLLSIPLDPVSLGARLNVASTIYERFRIVKITIRYVPSLPTTFQGRLVMGVHDDATSPVVPTTEQQVLNFRCSKQTNVYKQMSFRYQPVDTNRWFYCNADSVNDLRFTQPGVLFTIGTQTVQMFNSTTAAALPLLSGAVGTIQCDFVYAFCGRSFISD